jgi:hypothetical protein
VLSFQFLGVALKEEVEKPWQEHRGGVSSGASALKNRRKPARWLEDSAW